jgi:hypothetical protein
MKTKDLYDCMLENSPVRKQYKGRLTQEQWQEIYQKYLLPEITLGFNARVMVKVFYCWFHENFLDLNHNLSITELWCLFVHNKVYNLEWDWEEKKWL